MNPIHSKPGFAKGLRPALPDRAHLKFGDFLPNIPTSPIIDLAPDLNYPMDLNDKIGDCVDAMGDHGLQAILTQLTGTYVNWTEDQLIAFYQTQNPGFDINGTSDTNGPGSSYDGGMNIQLFLEYLQQNGYILGFAKVDHTNPQEVQSAIWIGLALMAGVTLQDIQMDQFNNGQPWTPVEGSAIDGDHGVPFVGFGQETGNYSLVTWAKLQECTQVFMTSSVNELWFVLTPAHVSHPGFRNSFDVDGFKQAVLEITGGQIVVPATITPPSLFSETLKEGMVGPDVVTLQNLLKINSDGIFGPNTLEHVILFQTLHDLAPDGVVGPKTQAVLSTLVVPPVMQPNTYSKSFIDSVNNTLGYEGGLTQDPNDPGGTTNWGISQRSYPNLDIVNLTRDQAVAIYHSDFWLPIHGDEMPQNLAMNVFDCAVNCGTGTSIKMMQNALGINQDGSIGPLTLSAMAKATVATVNEFAYLRTKYYESLKDFSIYGQTWLARTNGTLSLSLS